MAVMRSKWDEIERCLEEGKYSVNGSCKLVISEADKSKRKSFQEKVVNNIKSNLLEWIEGFTLEHSRR